MLIQELVQAIDDVRAYPDPPATTRSQTSLGHNSKFTRGSSGPRPGWAGLSGEDGRPGIVADAAGRFRGQSRWLASCLGHVHAYQMISSRSALSATLRKRKYADVSPMAEVTMDAMYRKQVETWRAMSPWGSNPPSDTL